MIVLFRKIFVLFAFMLVLFQNSFSQTFSNKKIKSIELTDSLTKLDSLSILSNSFRVFDEKGNVIDSTLYILFPFSSTLYYKGILPVNLRVEYLTYALDLTLQKKNKDTSIIATRYSYSNPFRITDNTKTEKDLFDFGGLTKSGSLSRAITVGNNQNLAVNSNFNLQLSGKLTDDIYVIGSITDNNIPIQPDGNTQQLQDFDQVFIQLYNDKDWKLIAGDFITQNQTSYFLRFQKKGKGLSFEKEFNLNDSALLNSKTDLAISRGKFATNQIQGIEGNQGPYKLVGAENEQTITVLSATEQIFIDGKLLERGADQDYTIDYNAAEVVFTAKQLITKNKRIVIQFQYSDKNYVRSITQSQLAFTNKKWDTKFNVYSEQDHKNQPLQQTLDDPEKRTLFNAGDNLSNAFIYKVDTITADENAVIYLKKDSLGYSIFEYNPSLDTNRFSPRFSFVGNGNGNYIQNGFSPFGRVYQWVKPDTVLGQIIQKGNYEPIILLISPKRKQLITLENKVQITENTTVLSDVALSNTDINTFSPQGNKDNVGLGGRFGLQTKKGLGISSAPWVLSNITNIEFINKDFEFIERYRPVEFSRNWNILNQNFDAPQLIGSSSISLQKQNMGGISYNIDALDIDKYYRGIKNGAKAQLNLKKATVLYDGSYLKTTGQQVTGFYRHKSFASYAVYNIVVGYEDETEQNKFLLNDTLLNNSYQFYDGALFIKTPDTAKNTFKLYGRFREEKNKGTTQLKKSAYSNDVGLNYGLQSKNKKTRFYGNSAYRKLTIIDSTIGKAPDNTLVNQANFSTSFFKRFIQWGTYYEIGSGLEQKREFVYIQVNSGQGTYAWIDYNNNGIEELNEFEIALYQDQANYIRVFTQSNTYVTAYTNNFSQSLNLDPKMLIGETKKPFLLFISKFSSLSSYKTERKTSQEDFRASLNPFLDNADSSLISLNKQFRSSFFYNRTGYKYGLGYTYQDTRSKTLLSNGFDAKGNIYHEAYIRYKVNKWLYTWENTFGNKSLRSDYLSSRNYNINYLKSQFTITYQKDANQLSNITYGYEEKKNILAGEYAVIHRIGGEIMYNMVNNINLSTQFHYLNILFTSPENTSLAYEMLEGLKQGNNFTWEVLLNKRIAKNLSLSINYRGRKPEDIKAIHSGTIEIRAFF